MTALRRCSRTGCGRPSVATLTYVYADSTAVVGPLATHAEPHTYDLCETHAASLTAPRGWAVVRQEVDPSVAIRSDEDLVALANAVREAGRPGLDQTGPQPDRGRRGHLRALPDPR